MTKVKKSWMAVVMGALLLGTLVGVVWARPHDRPQAADITRKVTMTGDEFIVRADGYNWFSNGTYVECSSGACMFFAPVVFPCLPSVTVERVKLHVADSNGTATARAELHRAQPSTAGNVYLGEAASPPGTAGFQTFTSPAINKRVWPSQRAHIYLAISGPNIRVYGVTVEYHRNI
jgi:hypothetical protein